jgi:DNA-binding NtrC family response regulator
VHCARNGNDGKKLLETRSFDLALIDAHMPGIPGLELAAVAANENIPALIMSGHPDAAEKCDRFGFPYLSKPFGLEALARETERVMADKAAIIRQVKEATGRMRAEMQKLKSAMAESARLVADSKEVAAEATKVPTPWRADILEYFHFDVIPFNRIVSGVQSS